MSESKPSEYERLSPVAQRAADVLAAWQARSESIRIENAQKSMASLLRRFERGVGSEHVIVKVLRLLERENFPQADLASLRILFGIDKTRGAMETIVEATEKNE